MALHRDQLPDDVETLKRLLIGREELIEKLMAEISRLRRWRFGRSSERTDTELAQLQLLLEGLQAALSVKNDAPESKEHIPAEDSKEQDAKPGKGRGKRPAKKRGEIPAHFPLETIVHVPASCSCPDCGAKMRTLGEDVSEQLDYVPGYYKVLRHVRPKLSCGNCSRVIQLPAPNASDPARPAHAGANGPRDGLQVRRPHAAVPPADDFPALGARIEPLAAHRLGGGRLGPDRSADRCGGSVCAGRRQDPRR